MLSSQASGAAARAGARFRQGAKLDSQDAAAGEPTDVVLWDLACEGASPAETTRRLREIFPQARIAAYAPHVHEDRLAAAKAAGCDEVLSRGQFVRELNRLVSGKFASGT